MLPAKERKPASGAPDAANQEAWDRDFEASPPPPLPIGETGQPAIDALATPVSDALAQHAPPSNALPDAVHRGPEVALETLPVRPAVVTREAQPRVSLEREGAQASPVPSAECPVRPLSMAETWAAAQAAPKVPLRLIVAGVVGLVAFASAMWLWHIGNVVTAPPLVPPSLDSVLAQASGHPQRDVWLKDVLAARSETPQSWDPGGALATIQAPQEQRLERRTTAIRSRPRSRTSPAQNSEPARPASQTDDFYGAIFGSAQRYRIASAKPSSPGPLTMPSGAKASNAEGIVLRARLQDEVSSDPAGAPVIAVLARRADAGAVRLAPGTELHGRVVGSPLCQKSCRVS